MTNYSRLFGLFLLSVTFAAPGLCQNSGIVKKDSIKARFSALGTPGLLNNQDFGMRLKNPESSTAAEDMIRILPFSFVEDLGSLGQRNEALLYGRGFGNTGFIKDGLSLNSRINGAYNLNLLQAGSIDSVELVSLPRGFLYGSSMNSSAVSFLSREAMPVKPYTRIMFYQAPRQEGMIMGALNYRLAPRTALFLQFTNRSTDSLYDNTEYGQWLASGKLRQLVSDRLNLSISYSYARDKVSLFGGADPLKSPDIYDALGATVRYPNRYEKSSEHFISMDLMQNYLGSTGTLSLYYKNSNQEFRQDEHSPGSDRISDDNKYSLYGVGLRQKYAPGPFNFDFIADAERITLENNILKNSCSAAVLMSCPVMDNSVIPSLFGRMMNYSGKNYSGAGFDLNIPLKGGIQIYAGISSFKKPFDQFEESVLKGSKPDRSVYNFETGLRLLCNGLSGRISFFISRDNGLLYDSLVVGDKKKGLNLMLGLQQGKFYSDGNLSYYIGQNEPLKRPDYSLSLKIGYRDMLFGRSLDLKTGFSLGIIGTQEYFSYDQEYLRQIPSLGYAGKAGTSFRINYFAQGRIKERALLFLEIENLLNRDYFTVPFYPERTRSLKFGVSWEFFN